MRGHLAHAHKVSREVRHMRRVMLEELGDADAAEAYARLRGFNPEAIERYKAMLGHNDGTEFRKVDPRYLHMMIVGAFDFFITSGSLLDVMLDEDGEPRDGTADFEAFVADIILNGLRVR